MKRITLFLMGAIALAVTFNFAIAQTKAAFTPAQKAALGPIIHDYIVQHPEVLVQASQALQQKSLQQQKSVTLSALHHIDLQDLLYNPNSPVVGNPKGKVTLVEFFDYQCLHCYEMRNIVDNLIKANPDLRVVFKEFPIFGKNSELASRATLAANKQGKFYEFHHAIWDAKKAPNESFMLEIAEKLHLDIAKFKTDLENSAIKEEIKHNQDLAARLKIMGTPAFIVMRSDATSGSDMDIYPGQAPQSALQSMIDAAR